MLKSKLLTNKYVLYAVLVLSIINVLGYIETNNFDALALKLIAGYITSYFTKNMIVILLVSLLFGTCKVCISSFSNNLKEGFDEDKKIEKKQENMDQPDYKEFFNSSMGALDRLLGKRDFEGLSSVHGSLIRNQKDLLESLVNLKPVLEESKEKLEMANEIDTKKLGKLMDKMNNGELSGLMSI
tara:strand:- start:2116 stop:2667 length:552 start_codon:yes stop_codon:yes gene_type:complete